MRPIPIWTPEKWARAQSMRSEGYRDEAIADELDLTLAQVKSKFNNNRWQDGNFNKPQRLTDRYIRERDARKAAAEARDLTAQFCGDPPKGFSALDQKRAGQS